MTELPNGWQKVRFGDIFKVKYGKAIDKALRKESARYPVVGSAGIMTYTDEPLSIDPTIVIGRKGNVGSIQIFEHGCYPIDTTYYMQPASQFDIKFLTLLLTSLELVKLDSSTATPSLRREDLENVSFFVPPFPEQQKIVETLDDHLSRLDAALADVKQARFKAAQFRRSLLQAAFTGNLTGDGTHLMTAWRTQSLKNWGMQAQSGFASGVHNADGRGVTHLRPMNISRLGKLDLEIVKSVEDDSTRRIMKGDILFNNTNSAELVGKTTIIEIEGDFAFSNHMTRLRFPVEKVNHKYMSMLLHSFWMSGFFNQICSNHVNQASVAIKRLEQVEVALPPLPEQQKIVEILEDHLAHLDALVAIADAMEKQSATLRRSLLQAAFTGQLTKEVASV